MDSIEQTTIPDLVVLTAEVVASYVSKNPVSPSQLPDLISSVHSAFTGVLAPPKPQEPERQAPRISIKKSITPDYLVSLEDGRHYKSLKRHLAGHGLTPQEYRVKWGLPNDYPMVAPSYAQRRSDLAKAAGFGKKAQEARVAEDQLKARGRKKAA